VFYAKQHLNKPLFSIVDGKKLGEIKDLYLDGALNRVAAVFLGTEGLLRRKSLAIDRGSIQVLGVDTWLVIGSDRVTEFSSLADTNSLVLVSELKGREIQTEGGTKIGTVEDIVLDEKANVLGFTLGKVYVQGPLAERKIITRAAITNIGSKDTPMTTIFARAEESLVPEMEPDVQNQPVAEQIQG
jgi:sporulation protein YlmC with PRC-barrel domain